MILHILEMDVLFDEFNLFKFIVITFLKDLTAILLLSICHIYIYLNIYTYICPDFLHDCIV